MNSPADVIQTSGLGDHVMSLCKALLVVGFLIECKKLIH